MEQQKNRRKYDSAYKQQVLQMLEDGQSASRIAQSLGIGESLIYSWKRQAQEALAVEKKKEEPSELLAENERLRRKVRELEEAQAILKKALSILSHGI